MLEVDYWECPNCPTRLDANTPHVQSKTCEDPQDRVQNECPDCLIHNRGEVMMEPVMQGQSRDAEPIVWEPSKELLKMHCPDCDSFCKGCVGLENETRYWCDECGRNWASSDFDNCVDCGKPLGGSEMICHSCAEKESEVNR